MKTPAKILLSLLLFGLADAVYKQWIPNTNFENASNWHEQRVPCSEDQVIFPYGQAVSIYVQSVHSLNEMSIPWDGEFILAPGAGFSAPSEGDTECEKGSEIHFQDPDRYQWFDPTLWHSLHPDAGSSLFCLDAELVPCQYDDVIFSPKTSFRVITKATGEAITMKSISVLGKKFTMTEDFSQHLQTNTGKLQFPGPPQMHIRNLPCEDATGCECGNAEVLQEICSALQLSKGKCPSLPCAFPLLPSGQCCKTCGAIIMLEYLPMFNFDSYRNHLVQTFLKLAKYSKCNLSISKVLKEQAGPVKNAPGSTTEIQIVVTDLLEESQTGSDAISMANDIMDDINNNGISFGVSKVTMRTSASQAAPSTATDKGGMIAGIVIGVLIICLAVLGALYFINKAGFIRLPLSVMFRRDKGEPEMDPEPKGFDNPMFETTGEDTLDKPGIDSGEETLKDIPKMGSGFHFDNPLYDPSKCDV